MVALHRSLLVIVVALGAACGGPGVELPSIEGWGGEPQVAEAIGKARSEARREPSAAKIGRLGEFFHAHDLFGEAVDCYRQALELEPTSARWPYLAALATRKLELEPSLELFELALERGTAHPALLIHLGDTLAQLNRPAEAIERYREAVELEPESSHALLGLARVELTRSNTDIAREHLERARKIAPRHGEVRRLLARAYQRLGRDDDAEAELLVAGAYPDPTQTRDPIMQGVEARAVNSVALIDRGRRLARAGRFAEAETHFRRVLEIRPGTAVDHSNLGGALASQGKTEAAIAEYRRALEIEPENAQAHNNLAMALATRGDIAGAIRHLGRALASEPDYTEAHHNLGLVQTSQGRTAVAVSHYREALRHNPSFAQAHSDLGTALEALGEREAARESWRRALEIDPNALAALYNLSVALSRDRDHAAAIAWLERGLAVAPNSSRLAGLLAWELATAPDSDLRDGERAIELAERVFAAYQDQPQAGDVFAASLAEAGRFDRAIEIAGRAYERAAGGGQPALAQEIGARLSLYRRGVPFHQER